MFERKQKVDENVFFYLLTVNIFLDKGNLMTLAFPVNRVQNILILFPACTQDLHHQKKGCMPSL